MTKEEYKARKAELKRQKEELKSSVKHEIKQLRIMPNNSAMTHQPNFIECCFCHHRGASLKCFTPKCNNYYHLPCAIKDKCAFNQDKVNFIFIIFLYLYYGLD